MNEQAVKIIVTGGTIDKIHNTQTEGLSFAADGSTHIPELLTVGRCHFPTVELLMLKDSLEFDEQDRQAILNSVEQSEEQALVITHGTGTMDLTAQFLKKNLIGNAADKTIVLTGAMRPFSLFHSDGNFNLGGAVIAAQTLPSGIYAVMNGRVFEADKVHKNTAQGRFDL